MKVIRYSLIDAGSLLKSLFPNDNRTVSILKRETRRLLDKMIKHGVAGFSPLLVSIKSTSICFLMHSYSVNHIEYKINYRLRTLAFFPTVKKCTRSHLRKISTFNYNFIGTSMFLSLCWTMVQLSFLF